MGHQRQGGGEMPPPTLPPWGVEMGGGTAVEKCTFEVSQDLMTIV